MLIRKGISLLILFFGLSILVTVALSMLFKPDNIPYLIFIYFFSTSQLFLFLHSMMYMYYTSEKLETEYEIERRNDDFDDKTLVIVSAYDEDNDVLKPTFNAVKKSFTGPLLLAVDSPKNVRSYFEFCKHNDIICIHRINRSGYKAGAINNVLLNFLGNQHEYIKKTKRIVSDEIIYAVNNYDDSIFEMHNSLQSLDNTLSIIDNTLNSSRNDIIFHHISTLTSKNQTNNLHPKNIASLRFNIEQLREKIDGIISYHDRYYIELFTLNKMIKPINQQLLQLSPDIDYLEKGMEYTFNKMTSMQMTQVLSKIDNCLNVVNGINDKKFSDFREQKDELFGMMSNIENMINDISEHTMFFKQNNPLSNTEEERILNQSHLKILHSNLKMISASLSSINNSIKLSHNNLIFHHISDLISKNHDNHILPKDIDLLYTMIRNNRTKLDDIDTIVESLYDENISLEPILESSKLDPLQKLKTIRSKIEDLESSLIISNSQVSSHDVNLHNAIKSNRTKLDKIDGVIDSLYDKYLYNPITQLASSQPKFLQPNLEIMSLKIKNLQKDLNDFHRLVESLSVTTFIPNLKVDIDKIICYPNPQLSTSNIRYNDHVKDLVAEFHYVMNDLIDYLPLDIENIILLDSDAHPKSDPNPQNNFFDLCAEYIKENDLIVFPQFYDKDAGNMARAAYAQQVPFMKTIMPKRGKDNTAFMLGTNIMIKKSTLEGVNGFDESTVTEDLATTIKIHESNAKSKYVNKDVVVNGAPLSIKGYFAQQQRWAYGTFQVFFHMLLHGIGNDLSLKKYIEYMYGNTWYFYGLAFLINALIPLYALFLDGLIEIPPNLFFLLYLPYVFTGIIIFVYSVLRTKHGFTDVYYNMCLNAFCFYIYTKSLFLVLSGKKIPFEVTPKSGSSEATILRYKKITPVLIVIGLLGFAAVGHTVKILNGDVSLTSGLINVMWSLFFMFLLSSILRFK